MKKLFFILLLSIFFLSEIYAQHTFYGKIINADKEPIDMAQVLLSINDSIFAAGYANDKGDFIFKNLPSENYILHINSLGYSPLKQTCSIKKNLNATFVLFRSEVKLDEIVVIADVSERVKRTATGEIFYLSKEAKSRGNAYLALQEIPKLISNDGTQTVKMEDGSSPMIMIDGIGVNSGIAPIDPADIESVEVMDIVSARYLKQGVKNIVNIKLKRKSAPYLFFETATRHDIPLRNGFGVVYFEVGNPKFSLYGRTAYDYTYHDDSKTSEWQKGENYYKEALKKSRKNGSNYIGELLLKWRPGEKDFIIAHVYGTKDDKKQETWGNGEYTSGVPASFTFNSDGKNESYIFTGSLYHKHVFAPKKNLETTLAYNRNGDKNRNNLIESYNNWKYDNFYKYQSDRWSGSFDINYSWDWDVHSLNIGNSISYLNDNIDKVSENGPIFHHKKWNEYFYVDFSSKISKLYYLISAGIEGIWTKAGDFSNNYIKPRISLSGTYEINKNNSFRLGYTLTNEAPPVGQLNPYNTSVDSLVIIQGNPKLLPTQNHILNGSFTFNKWGFYFTPSILYNIYADKIEPYGYSENDIYISTYQNIGKSKKLSVGGSASYRFKYGRVYASAYHKVDYFTGLSPKKNFAWGGGLSLNYKKWSFVGDFEQSGNFYTAVSRMKQVTPYTHLQLIYKFSNNMYVSVALSNAIGRSRIQTFTYGEHYSSYNQQSKTYYPWVLFRYTLRKNAKKKIEVDNVVRSKESGIAL